MTDELITSEQQEVLQAEAPEEALPVETAPLPERVTVADIQFRSGSKVYFFDPGDLTVKAGDHVIMDTARGHEFGYCTGGNHEVSSKDIVPPLRKILRIANAKDEQINNENIQKEKKAYEVCQQKILEQGLDMQLVSAECAFDGSKIIFFFTADGRVDFRELVKNLASIFRTRIELRQIGVRDKAKMVGGLGICGRPFCCKEFLDDFQPVSIKMAKTQNLSLNPTKISGTCGRLMCCLKYEQDAYEDLLKTSPKNESFVDTVDGRGTVVEVNLLRQCVRVRMENQPETINTYKNCDICVLRNGKAKKTDPPIPDDLAPLSSLPKPAKKRFVELESEPMPEVIIGKAKSDESAPAEAPVRKAEKPEPKEKPEGSSNRRKRKKKPAAPQEAAAPKAEAQEKPRQPKAEKPRQDKKPEQQKQEKKNDQPKAQKPRQSKAEKPEQAEGAPKAEGGSRKPYYRRRRRPHSGPKPDGAPKGE